MPLLSVVGLKKVFQGRNGSIEVLDGITFEAEVGQILVLRGPNGCGKTTLLNMIAGLDSPSAGKIQFAAGSAVQSFAYVFQNYSSSLLPWLTLRENITIPLRLRGAGRREQHARLSALDNVYSLEDVPTDRFPSQASGGQKQRACIARAALCESDVFLMDEPMSSLDQEGRLGLLCLVESLRAQGNRLIIMVLHDLDDALVIGDRLLVFQGRPATLRADILIDLPRPRYEGLKLTPEFGRLRQVALEQSQV